MGTDVYALIEHKLKAQEIVDLAQLLSNYSISSQVSNYPNLDYFYLESRGDGTLHIPKEWIEGDLNNDLYEYEGIERITLPVLNGLALEIFVYKKFIKVQRYSGIRWTSFVLDPLRRCNFRKDIQVLANFLESERVIYLSNELAFADFEEYTIERYLSELDKQGYSGLTIQSISNRVKSCQQVYQEEEPNYYIDNLNNPILPKHIEILANLQLSVLSLILDSDEVKSLEQEYFSITNIVALLKKLILNYNQYQEDVLTNLGQEITVEQTTLLELLNTNLTELLKQKNLREQASEGLWVGDEWISIQKLAAETLDAFYWDFFDLYEWLDEVNVSTNNC